MAENYCFITVKKIKSMHILQCAHGHNTREFTVINADPDLRDRNEELINLSGKSYNDLWRERIKKAEEARGEKLRIRKDAVRAMEVVMTFTKNDGVDVEQWKKDNVAFLQEQFGKDNVISAQFHGDEPGNVHIHAIVIPITEDNRLCSKDFIGGTWRLRRIQNAYAREMEKHGLVRGLKRSRARHQDLRRFYAVLNNAVQAKVPEREAGEEFEAYVERVNAYLQNENLKRLGESQAEKRKTVVVETEFANYRRKYFHATQFFDEVVKKCGNVGAALNFLRELLRFLHELTIEEFLRRLSGKKERAEAAFEKLEKEKDDDE